MTQRHTLPSTDPVGPVAGPRAPKGAIRLPASRAGLTHGFTLLELLIGMVVLGILMSIGVSSMARWRQQLDADNYLAGLASEFGISRTRTLATGELRRIRLVSASSYVVESRASAAASWSTLRTATFAKPMFDLAATVARNYEFETKGFVQTYTQAGQLTTSTDIRVLAGSGLKTLSISALGIARRQ